MKIRTFTLPLIFVIQLCFSTGLISQVELDFPGPPQDVTVCEAESLSFFEISFTDAITVDSITVKMPAGIQYVPESFNVLNGTPGLTLSELDISDPENPVFGLVFNDPVGNGDFIEFSISKIAFCDAVVFSAGGNLAYDTIGVWTDVLVVDSVTSNYNIDYASLFTSYVNSNDTIVNDLPSTVCRDIRIINGGTGYTSKIQHQVSPGSDLANYELRYQGTTLTPVSMSGGTIFYEFDLTMPPFAGTFGVEDTILQNGESIIIEECFTVNSCDFSDGSVTHQNFWGCGGELCQMGNVITGSVGLLFSQPVLRSVIDSLDNIVCMDGTDKGYIRMHVWNEGVGPSVLNQIALRANGGNTGLDISGFSIVDENGLDISEYFPTAAGSGSGCGTGQTSYTLSNNDFESSYQLLPGDTVTIVMQYVLCCPDSESCGPYTLSNPYVEIRGTDLCSQNAQTRRGSAGTGGTASVSDPVVSGMSVLAGGEVAEFCVEYPNYQFLDVGDSDSSYVTFMVELPVGLDFNNPSSSTFDIGGIAIPIQSTMVIGDSLLIHALLSDVENQPIAPIKVCFEVVAVCTEGPGGLTSMTLGQSTSIECDPLCFIKLNCSSHDILLLGCGPGDCDLTGGGIINSYEVERISYGYVDNGDDRNWDNFVHADASDVNVKRAMVGDTIRHLSQLGFSTGSTTSWSGGTYRETYTAGWEDKLCPDTAWVEIVIGGTTYVVGGLEPTAIQNGFEYDLSITALSGLPGGNSLPSSFTAGDVVNLNTQYAFCKENAPEWFSVGPGVYRPDREQQNVIFTGNFAAIPEGGGDPIACNERYDEMLFLGASLSVDIRNGGFSGSGCNRDFRYLIEIEQNIGGVLSGYTGTFDFFPNEFRPLYIPDSIVVKKPADVTFNRAWLVTQQIENLNTSPNQQQKIEDIPMSLISETDTTIILRVRDVHDAFGGSLFPYDEENADLRYYISFSRSCESPRNLTTDLSIAYTTLLCPGDDFETEATDMATGNNTDLYNINYVQSPISASSAAINNNTCFELLIRPGGDLSFTWLEFPENDSVSILSVSVGGTILTPNGNGLYELGAQNGNSTRTITICADLNGCNQGDFEVLHGWSCSGYPDEMNEETCTYETFRYTIETVESELQFNLLTQPSNSTPGNLPDFCAPLFYELVVNSANAGSVINPRIEINLPVGFEINDIVAQYPNGLNPESIPYSTTLNTISVDLTAHSLLVDSLPGTATVTTPENRQVKLQIFGQTNCDFISGTQLFFTSYGERPCGGPVIGNGIRRASDRLFINGVQPYQIDPFIDIQADQGVTCSVGTPVNVSYQVVGGDFTGLDSGLLRLSPGLDFVPESLICSGTSVTCPVIDRIIEDPANPGGSLVYFSYDGTIATEGETIDFTFEVKAQESTTCGQMVNIQLENFVTVQGVVCEGMECEQGVTGITGVDTLEMEVIHPILDFTNLEGVTIAGSDYLEYTGSVTLDQRALTANDSLYVLIYCADGNGDPVDVVDSILIHGPVAIGGMVDFTGYFEQMACDLTNGLVFSVRPIVGCLCSEPLSFLPGDNIIEESREFDLALTKTVDQPVDLKYGDTLTFDIQIFNQGDVWADSFEITDYIPAGLTYLDTNTILGWEYDMAGKAKRWVAGPLLAGADTTIQIYLRLDYNTSPDAYLNYAEISQDENPIEADDIDSTPDDDPDNDGGGKPDSPSDDSTGGDGSGNPGDDDPNTDEDDHDPALVKVADLALIKVMSDETPGPYVYGDTLQMNIQLFNQGNVPTSYIEVTDYLPSGFTFINDPVINENWNGTDPQNPVYTWQGDTLYQGEMTEISISVILTMVESPDSASWTNYSEISLFRDTTGIELRDIDSTPDNDPSNDAGGKPDSPSDNSVDGDGSGEPGDEDPATDEDDHDPLRVEVYDLALRKVVSTNNSLPFIYNDTAIFDIVVYNQGNEPTQNIVVTDYIPTNMDFAVMHTVNAGWNAADPENPTFTIPGPLAPGADTTISIALILRQEAGVNNWINFAEISQFEDLDGNEPEDIDSTPDNDPDNDYGAQPLGNTDDEISGNSKGTGSPNGFDDPLFDEDDHDVAILDVVDLALIKVIDSLNSDFPLQFGSLIKFDIIIQNQGNVISDSVRVQDYVPAGFGFDPLLSQNAAQGWQADGTALLTKQLDFLEYDTVSLYLTLQPVADPQMDSWINYAEILHVYDTTGMEVGELDYDSSPGSDSEEERFILPGDDGDNDFLSPHRDSLGSEDDHDPAGVMFLDLALFKQVDSTATSFPVAYGDIIKFDIYVINQEGIMADSVRVRDYVPEGYHFDPNNPDNLALGWQSDTTAFIQGPVNVGDTVSTSIYLELRQVSVPTDRTWVNYAEISEVWAGGMEIGEMDIDSEPDSDSPEEREVYPGHPGDDDVMSITRESIGSEDDHDPAFVEVFDLALRKTTEEEVAYPGLDVAFDITIFNQGGIPASNIEVTDYIPAGFTFNAALNPDWSGGDPLVTYLIGDTLYPGESTQISIVLTVTDQIAPENLINVAEISAAQDTTGQPREDIDGVFDQDPDNDPGGAPDSPADDYVDGDGSGEPGDGNSSGDEDNADPAKILPCLNVNCHAYINLAFGTDCEILVTPDMLLVDNRLAAVAPQFYEVELFYGPGIRIPDNILRPEHVGREITARITFLIEECGGGTCEATIVLEKPNACLIRNTLDTTVYCIDPFLALDPLDPAYPKPELANICNSAELKLELSPDWIMPVSCDESNDTAEIIYREWTATTLGGERCTGVDTIVVLRLPKLTPGAFVDSAHETYYCEPTAHLSEGDLLVRYASWKQPVGLHDYELPYSKLRGLVYEIPATIILAGLTNAYEQGTDVYTEYLQSVILRKANGVDSVTIGDIVGGAYMDDLIANASQEQKLYGFLYALIAGNENPLVFLLGASVDFYPYLLLQEGDWVLSEGGYFEEVTIDWFYTGTGNQPYWFAGGWPSVYGNGEAVSYCDVGGGSDYGCIRIQVPRLIHGVGFDPEICDTICLTPGGVHCGITIEQEGLTAGWDGSCPQGRSLETTITQTCWSETPNNCAADIAAEDVDLIASYDSTAKRVEIKLSHTQTLIDTIAPIFDFEYSADWDQGRILDSIKSGKMPEEAYVWEQNNPTTYRMNSHSCDAEVFVPDVQVVDNCSGIHSVKAMVEVRGGNRVIALEHTGTEMKFLTNGDTCYILTYSHRVNPLVIPPDSWNACDGELKEVRYEAADNCWNQSTWSKFIQINDETPPTVVVNRNLNVTLRNSIAWARAESLDEGSWDNCAIDLKLARRVNWLNDESVKLCGPQGTNKTYDNWVDLLADLGIQRTQVVNALQNVSTGMDAFNEAYNIDKLSSILNEGEVENYYFNQLVWLWEDTELAGRKAVHGWLYEMAAHMAENCSVADEHGNFLRIQDLVAIFDYLAGQTGYGQEMAVLGGGWVKEVPVTCTDACSDVAMDLVVMDHCGNWGVGRTEAYVDDQSQSKTVTRLSDLDITCEAYRIFYQDIVENAASLGENGSELDQNGYFADLDSVFGRYVLTLPGQGQASGNSIGWSAEEVNFDYFNITCAEKSEVQKVEVVGHDGTVEWVNRVSSTTFPDTVAFEGQNGIVEVNCLPEGNIQTQDVWIDLDECGVGTITRRFTIQNNCGGGDGLTFEQVINISPACVLRESMFDLPSNAGSPESPVCLSESLLSLKQRFGNLTAEILPSEVGAVTLKPHLEGLWCNSLAFGTEVKEFNLQDFAGLKKYVITWSVLDWCATGTGISDKFEYTQEVIAVIDENCGVSAQPDSTGQSIVSGHIMTELSSPIEDVIVKAVTSQNTPLTVTTSSEGTFEFDLRNGSQLSIIPGKNTGFSEGITTADLIDIQRHILGQKTLEGPYRLMAADVNGNGFIDGLDVLELRQIVLNPKRSFASNTSWRFFESTTGQEVLEIGKLMEDMTMDFIGTKIGDVNLSADPVSNNRSATGQLHLNIADVAPSGLQGGGIYRIDVRSDNFKDIRGFQYTLEYSDAHIDIESIVPGILNITEENYLNYGSGVATGSSHLSGVLTASWSEATGVSASPEEVLFTIVIKAKNAAALRDVLSLSHLVTRSEAYSATGELYDVAMRFDAGIAENAGFALYQNKPNPYNGETVIGFSLPEASKATMTIYNVTGKLIKRIEGEFDAGYNEVRMRADELGTTGVLYYQLDTDQFTATKKMIVVE